MAIKKFLDSLKNPLLYAADFLYLIIFIQPVFE